MSDRIRKERRARGHIKKKVMLILSLKLSSEKSLCKDKPEDLVIKGR